MGPEFATVPISELRVGATLRAPIYETRDDRDILLLAAGATITDDLLDKLRERGLSQVRVHRTELSRVTSTAASSRHPSCRLSQQQELNHTAQERDSTSQTVRPSKAPEPRTSAPFPDSIRRHGVVSYRPENEQQFMNDFEASLVEVDAFFGALNSGRAISAHTLASVSSEMLMKIAEDIDLFVAIGIRPESGKYPHRHCVQTLMLATAMGAIIGLTKSELIELGIGCLAHDAGMLQISAALYEAERKLTEAEFREIKKHPLLALDLVKDLDDLPERAQIVIQQMHERMNGDGYPQKSPGHRIHRLARIAAVADVFVALVSPRPHRPAGWPYYAMEQIIKDTGRGLFDEAATRALLHTVTMFPIGSFVEVSDGRVGKVLRANGEAYTRPIVALRNSGEPDRELELVDLSSTEELRVIRPLETLGAA